MKSLKTKLRLLTVLSVSVILWSSCKKDTVTANGTASGSPQANAIKPDSAAAFTVLTLTGTGLGDVRSIVFENGNVPAFFNSNFNTDESLIFRVPDTANGGTQKIIFTNSKGIEFSVPFKVLAFPTSTDVSNYNFTGGTQITITGNNLNDVSKVVFTGTTTNVTVVSKTKKQLVIQMPTSTLVSTKLDITNASGTITTTQEFVNLDMAFAFFTEGYQNGEQDASWGDGGIISNTISKSGTMSISKKYAQGNWHQFGFGWNQIPNAGYKFFSFWIKGASQDYDLWLSTDKSVGGFASFNAGNKVTIPANVWTYFKIPMFKLDFYNGGTFQQLGFRIQGPNSQDETFYLDDVIFIK